MIHGYKINQIKSNEIFPNSIMHRMTLHFTLITACIHSQTSICNGSPHLILLNFRVSLIQCSISKSIISVLNFFHFNFFFHLNIQIHCSNLKWGFDYVHSTWKILQQQMEQGKEKHYTPLLIQKSESITVQQIQFTENVTVTPIQCFYFLL
jgi:hypothetical protein